MEREREREGWMEEGREGERRGGREGERPDAERVMTISGTVFLRSSVPAFMSICHLTFPFMVVHHDMQFATDGKRKYEYTCVIDQTIDMLIFLVNERLDQAVVVATTFAYVCSVSSPLHLHCR